MVRSFISVLLLAASGKAARIAKHRNKVVNNSVGISIVNGQPAEECEWTWQVGLTGSVGQSPFCGGMLISADYVLTAAHCLVYNSINVIAGEWDTTQSSVNEQNRMSQDIIPHPNYNSNTMAYDFGLIKVVTPFTINGCVSTVPLPGADVADASVCTITGWGTLSSGGSQPTRLQEAEVTIISNSACTTDYGYSSNEIDNTMICAQGRLANGSITDACQGDSGGPLVCQVNSNWVIHGATSWGYGCAGANYPGVWSRVYTVVEWIEGYMSGSVTPTPTPAPSQGSCSNGECEYDAGQTCQCDSQCGYWGDCCADYSSFCP